MAKKKSKMTTPEHIRFEKQQRRKAKALRRRGEPQYAPGPVLQDMMKIAGATTMRFSTGAQRSSDVTHVRYDLLSPIALERVAMTMAEGANKHGAFNWENGMPIHDLLNHAIRHLYQYLSGDRSEDHLAHAAWNVMSSIHSEVQWPELNRPHLRTSGCQPPKNEEKPQ